MGSRCAHDVDHTAISQPPSSTSTSTRCDQCNLNPVPSARNLIVCIDGTSNKFGENNTNVLKLFDNVDVRTTGTDPHPKNNTNVPESPDNSDVEVTNSHPEQLKYYASGIGTDSANPLRSLIEVAIAWGKRKTIQDSYGWLARTYREGDQIYLFGFSRGAYQVRVLAAMIHEVGLIKTPTEKQIGAAYKHYKEVCHGKPMARQMARKFKNMFSWEGLRVHFVGVWDTVSSVGFIKKDVFLSVSSCAAHSCHFRHALALNDNRVKFIPEYFHEMNSLTNDWSKYATHSVRNDSETSVDERHDSAGSNDDSGEREKVATIKKASGSNDNSGMRKKAATIKEVWFAGSHSDVGGVSRIGSSHEAGKVPLLWMLKEAAENGLVLQPINVVWDPNDLDRGVTGSMTLGWALIELTFIKHQVSFNGPGRHGRIPHHFFTPRRIIPGQKVHASILYANEYSSRAIERASYIKPIIDGDPEDTKLDDEIWDTRMLDDTAAQNLVKYLSDCDGTGAEIYVDKLLFMLRFEEGRESLKAASREVKQLSHLIKKSGNSIVRLVALIIYHATCSPEDSSVESLDEVFNSAKHWLRGKLSSDQVWDDALLVAVLRPLTKNQLLREGILTPDFLDYYMNRLDEIMRQPQRNFRQAMNILICLLHCEGIRQSLVERLGDKSTDSRLSRMLDVRNRYNLDAALHMVMTLARFREGMDVCIALKPKFILLEKQRPRLLLPLAIQILLALHNPSDDTRRLLDQHIQANSTKVLSCLVSSKLVSVGGQCGGTDSERQVLRYLYGLDATELNDMQKTLIRELKTVVVVYKSNMLSAATMVLLKLCETKSIRNYIHEIDLLKAFIQAFEASTIISFTRSEALLGAYALTTYLEYDDFKDIIEDDERVTKCIIRMLYKNYFEDAVGPVEGFQIFANIIQHDVIREKIVNRYDITKLLKKKLRKGNPDEVRTSLNCLNIFHSIRKDEPWTNELVSRCIKCLQNRKWKTQKKGVAMLSALVLTKRGVDVIKPRLDEIIKMLLPEEQTTQEDPTTASQDQARPSQMLPPTGQTTQESPTAANQGQTRSSHKPVPFSRMMGPACALRILAQNKLLRDHLREMKQYRHLKYLYSSGILVDEENTSAWHVNTPNRADVMSMLHIMFKTIDEEDSEDSEESLQLTGDAVLPRIRHWARLLKKSCYILIPPLYIGFAGVCLGAEIALIPVVYLVAFCWAGKEGISLIRNELAMNSLQRDGSDTGGAESHGGVEATQTRKVSRWRRAVKWIRTVARRGRSERDQLAKLDET